MTEIRFSANPPGFVITGHASKNAADETGRIVCAAVSSAAYMTANTITEIIADNADIAVDDAKMSLYVPQPSPKALAVLAGFKLHVTQLSKQYTKNIRIISEV